MGISVFDKMKSGELARLNPTVPDSKKEERATSILLATFRAVPDFARAMLSDAGISFPKTSQIECYTEVALEVPGSKRAVRPDGLIVLSKGKKQWLAFVESKTGSSQLKQDQCEDYLVLARQLGIDAVLTISNQYTAIPTHHPVSVSKTKTRKVGLIHFSWLSLMSKATLLTESRAVEDPEQAFLLQELVRFLKHPYSGVSSFTRMSKGWATLCASVKQGLVLRKKDPDINEAVLSWHQLIRFLALELTTRVGQPVQVRLSRRHTNDPSTRVMDDIDGVVKHSRLNSELLIPNAASALTITADLKRRTLNLSMRLKAPSNKKRATAPINWLIRQLKNVEREDLLIRAVWPRRMADTTATINDVRENPSCIVQKGVQELPQSLEVVRVVDLAGKFSGVKTFIEYASNEVPNFYKDVGEHIRPWVPPPPKLKRVSAPEDEDESTLQSDLPTNVKEQPYEEGRKATDNRSFSLPAVRDV
jgi:hypothetical protein